MALDQISNAIGGGTARLLVTANPVSLFDAKDDQGAPLDRALVQRAEVVLIQALDGAVWFRRDGGDPQVDFGTPIELRDEYRVVGSVDLQRLRFVSDGAGDVLVMLTLGKFGYVPA